MNENTLQIKRMKFATREKADAFFERRRKNANFVCEPKENYFTYFTPWGNKMFVKRMYN